MKRFDCIRDNELLKKAFRGNGNQPASKRHKNNFLTYQKLRIN